MSVDRGVSFTSEVAERGTESLVEQSVKNPPKYLYPLNPPYAHMLIVVTFLVVNFFTKMNIARSPGGFQVPGVVQTNPTGLPELFKPTRDLNFDQEAEQMKFQNIKHKKTNINEY